MAPAARWSPAEDPAFTGGKRKYKQWYRTYIIKVGRPPRILPSTFPGSQAPN
jgi:hypothetical protein